jgi:hypothetical protein
MARAYNIVVAALALDVDRKWLDNLTSQHSIPGTEHVARGVSRRLTLRALLIAALVRDLNRFLSVPVARAVALSTDFLDKLDRQAAETPQPDAVRDLRVGENIELRIDVSGIERSIEARLLDAMETVVPRRRGRPPRKERRGTP